MLSAKAAQQRILTTHFGGHIHALSRDASGCKESQFYSLPLHVVARCACFRFSTYLPTIFQGIIPRKTGVPYEKIVQNHLKVALLNVF